MKQIEVNGKQIKFGRTRSPLGTLRRLRLEDYLVGLAMPPAPQAADYTQRARASLGDVYGNDAVGDCVFAAGYHVEGVATANAGQELHVATAQVLADYSAVTGYNPADPSTDRGCDPVSAFAYWQKHGFANGTKLTGYLKLNSSNQTEIMQALYLFENLYLAFELPDAWINPFPSVNGFTWVQAGAPDPDNGHAIMAAAYNASGVLIDTWGMLGTLTWQALACYGSAANGGEVYTLLTPDMLSKATLKSPAGLDWAALIRDFDALGGTVPVPAPTPAPAPQPVPVPPVPAPSVRTLVEAQAALARGWGR